MLPLIPPLPQETFFNALNSGAIFAFLSHIKNATSCNILMVAIASYVLAIATIRCGGVLRISLSGLAQEKK